MIGVGIEKPDPVVKATVVVGFAPAFQAVTNIIFAYAGHVAFFTFISELKDPKDFPKALIFLQVWDISLYVVAAIVIYRYAGPEVASPALGSTTPVVKKVAYGIALPTIVIAGVIYAHVASKYIYLRIFRGTKHMGTRTWLAVGSWLAIIGTLWIIAWIIAESIPNFNDLLSLISSLFASWFTYGISGELHPLPRIPGITADFSRNPVAVHQLWHVVQELAKELTNDCELRDLCAWSCDLWYRTLCIGNRDFAECKQRSKLVVRRQFGEREMKRPKFCYCKSSCHTDIIVSGSCFKVPCSS